MADAFENPGWTLRDLAAMPRALVELARARIALARIDPAAIASRNQAAHRIAADAAPRPDLLRRVGRIVPSAASLVPWRADCLVQAIAAQNWLAAHGVSGEIELGVDRNSSGIEPHAWLRAGETIVTGGPIDRFTVLYASGAQGDAGP